jgi:hypothetical protein
MKTQRQFAECVAGVCMDERAHYWGSVWRKTLTLGPLSDRRIGQYERRGHYGERRAALRQREGRLVYNA